MAATALSMAAAAPRWRDLPPSHVARDHVAGQLVYAIGDIHGCYDLLLELLGLIIADAGMRAAGRRPVLILCGDYVDRGPRSADVIEAICWLIRRGPFVIRALRGNHEQALLDFVADPVAGVRWLEWGGEETLRSYGVEMPEPEDEAGLMQARDSLLEAMPAAHLRLLEVLEPMVEIGDYLFAHAGIRPGLPVEEQRLDDLLWIRGDFLDFNGRLPKIVVHGHSWRTADPVVRDNRIGIDTGAFATDVLTALRLDGTSRACAQTGAADA